jgi:hypothetical protein
MMGGAAVLLAWLAADAVLLRQFSVSTPRDAAAQCEANGGNWAGSSCMSPSEKASCFRPWTLSGPKRDVVCGEAVPPR